MEVDLWLPKHKVYVGGEVSHLQRIIVFVSRSGPKLCCLPAGSNENKMVLVPGKYILTPE